MTQGKQFISETLTKIQDTTSNPAPLGLLGFGMTTVLLNIHNAGFYAFNTMILGMGVCYGGLAQVIAGIQEWKKGNTFGATAFTSYGLFWLSLVALLMFPGSAPDKTATACLFLYVGSFHPGDVHRDFKAESSPSGRFWHSYYTVFPFVHPGCNCYQCSRFL